MMRITTRYILTALFTGFLWLPCKAQETLRIAIDLMYEGQPLVLETTAYRFGQTDSLYIDLLRFYITDIHLIGAGISAAATTAHLVDAADTSTCQFAIAPLAAGTYTSIQFTIGVDSASNTTGAHGGDLDPAKGMYWTWNTGYVMAKMEGRSPVCRSLHHAFEYHIGGFMPPFNTARQVILTIPSGLTITANGQPPTIQLQADAAAWFTGTDLSTNNSITIPGKEASTMADRYAKMFRIVR